MGIRKIFGWLSIAGMIISFLLMVIHFARGDREFGVFWFATTVAFLAISISIVISEDMEKRVNDLALAFARELDKRLDKSDGKIEEILELLKKKK